MLQLYGTVQEVNDVKKLTHIMKLWRKQHGITDLGFTAINMIHRIIKARMFRITPKKIKLFSEKKFDVEDGDEPVFEL